LQVKHKSCLRLTPIWGSQSPPKIGKPFLSKKMGQKISIKLKLRISFFEKNEKETA
jgi:hypothetical protein